MLHLVKASNDTRSEGCKFFCVFCPDTHLVCHEAWQFPPLFLDPTGALVSVVFLSTYAHMQMLIARSGTGGTLDLQDLTGTNQSLQLPAEAR